MKTVLIYSGGLDSTVLLYKLRDDGHEVAILSLYYGQRHSRELQAAHDIVLGLSPHVARYHQIDISTVRKLLSGSSQTDDRVAVPEGHYADESMRQTVVPNRNMIMLAIAAGWAVSLKYDAVSIAAHAGDHPIYPDCREEFFSAMQLALDAGNYHQVMLHSPFDKRTKADIVRIGADLDVPFAMTWSCYVGGAKHCGKCGTCVERREAFSLAGVADPTEYEV